MSEKSVVMIGFFIGSTLGGFIPTLFGSSFFSYSALIGNTIGAILGTYLGYKIAFG